MMDPLIILQKFLKSLLIKFIGFDILSIGEDEPHSRRDLNLHVVIQGYTNGSMLSHLMLMDSMIFEI